MQDNTQDPQAYYRDPIAEAEAKEHAASEEAKKEKAAEPDVPPMLSADPDAEAEQPHHSETFGPAEEKIDAAVAEAVEASLPTEEELAAIEAPADDVVTVEPEVAPAKPSATLEEAVESMPADVTVPEVAEATPAETETAPVEATPTEAPAEATPTEAPAAEKPKRSARLEEYLRTTHELLEFTRKERNSLIVRIDGEEDKITHDRHDYTTGLEKYNAINQMRDELNSKNNLIRALIELIRSVD